MPRETTNQTDTILSAVNSILGSIGQSPVSRLYEDNDDDELVFINPEIAFIYNILQEVNRDVQNEGWVFNREDHYCISPDCNNHINIPNNVLRFDVHMDHVYRVSNVVRRDGKLYDKFHHTYEFCHPVCLDITWIFPFEDLPPVFKRYIIHRASGRAATQLISNPQLVQLLATQEAQARASCMEYECNQGDFTMFGSPEGTVYQSYQPYRTLMR